MWPQLLVILGMIGCGRAIVQPLGPTGRNADAGSTTSGPDAGPPDVGPSDLGAPDLGSLPCDQLEEAQCGQTEDCRPLHCPTCEAQSVYFGCQDSQELLPCPDLLCPERTCADLRSQPSCDDAPDCGWMSCFDCDGNVIVEYCEDEGSPGGCPPIDCPPPACEGLSEGECLASPDCHGVFNGDLAELCDCDSPGCCVVFERCAEGAFADCSFRQVSCNRAAPLCDGPYSVSYNMDCYEGCARTEECAF